jgi:hypothetical protein
MKPWWKSKTLLLNIVVALLATLEASFHLLQPVLTGALYGIPLLLLALINTVLRIVTVQPVTLRTVPAAEESDETPDQPGGN